MAVLYHVSEQGGITRFHPRPASSTNPDDRRIWAIDESLLHIYLVPRDCPRVTFYALPHSKPEDIQRFMAHTTARHVMAVESSWLPAIRSTRLYLYRMPPETFTVYDEGAGIYISRTPVSPLGVTALDDLLLEMVNRDVELRIMPLLWELCDAVVKSSLQYSMVRMRNAAPRIVPRAEASPEI